MDNAIVRLKPMEGPEMDFAGLVTNIPVGICTFLRDANFTLVYGNLFFYEMFGYTPEQLRLEKKNELAHALFPEEHQHVKEAMDAQLRAGAADYRIEHRCVRRDGTLIWVLVSANFSFYDGIPAANCVVVDITDRKRMEERLRIDEERFRLALAQTDSTIFDYDIATKVMIHADKAAEQYGLTHVSYNVPDFLVEEKIVHPESASVFLEMYRQIAAGEPVASCVVRARTTDGRYAWRRISMSNIFDSDGKPVRAVGMLEDIDEQTQREEALRERSQRDALTGLYHKGATESRIREVLQVANCAGTLLILDIDTFKSVNDHYGHLFGDMVLAESACRIAGLCRREDVIGRIGGDEFMIFLEGAGTGEAAAHKAEAICAAFETAFTHGDASVHVTCSVGIAFCPAHGTGFEILYQRADIALYEAKRLGRNRYCSYEAGMGDSVEWVPYSSTQIDEPVAVCSVTPPAQP